MTVSSTARQTRPTAAGAVQVRHNDNELLRQPCYWRRCRGHWPVGHWPGIGLGAMLVADSHVGIGGAGFLRSAFGRRYMLVAWWKLGYWVATLTQPLVIAALLTELELQRAGGGADCRLQLQWLATAYSCRRLRTPERHHLTLAGCCAHSRRWRRQQPAVAHHGACPAVHAHLVRRERDQHAHLRRQPDHRDERPGRAGVAPLPEITAAPAGPSEPLHARSRQSLLLSPLLA